MKKKLLPLFLSQSFRAVAICSLSFFSAVYIFKKALALYGSEKLAFLAVIVFYILLYLAKLLAVLLAEEWSLRFGLKKQVLLGQFFSGLALASFLISENFFPFLWLAAMTWGAAIGFFWFGWHGLIAKDSQQGKFGQTLGIGSVIETIFLIIAPFMGGLVINALGYQALFGLSLLFIVLGVLVIFPAPDEKTHQDTDVGEIFRIFFRHKRMVLSYFSYGMIAALYSPVFILYTFLFLKTELALGGFFSLSMLVAAVANLTIGNHVDKRGKRSLIAYGSYFSFLAWLGRFLVTIPSILFLFDVIYRLASGMLGIPLGVLTYQKAREDHATGRAILFREISMSLGSLFVCLAIVVFLIFNFELKIIFLGGALFSLFPLLLLRKGGIYGEEVQK